MLSLAEQLVNFGFLDIKVVILASFFPLFLGVPLVLLTILFLVLAILWGFRAQELGKARSSILLDILRLWQRWELG